MHVVHSKILLATRRVAKNSLWGGLIWGYGSETTSRWEAIGSKAPSRWRHGGLERGAPSAQKLCIFLQK